MAESARVTVIGAGVHCLSSFKVFDTSGRNVHVIAESNTIEPFRFSRCAEGRRHPVGHSPVPGR